MNKNPDQDAQDERSILLDQTVEDISHRKRLEDVVQQQNQLLQQIINNVPDIIARFDRDLRHLFVNLAATRATGLLPEVFLGKTNRELGMPSSQVNNWDAALQSVFATGEERVIDFSFPTPDGVRWYQSKLAPERNEAGEVVSVLSVARDVTALRKAHEDLQRAMQAFQTLADHAPDIITRHDAKTFQYLYVNPAITHITGLAPEAFIGKRVSEVGIPEEQSLFFEQQLTQVVQTRSATTIEYSFPSRDQIRYYQSKLVPEDDSEHRLISILVITYDRTESKEQESLKDAFISMAGHELRTPLTSLKGNLQLASRQVDKLFANEQEPWRQTGLQEVQKRLVRTLRQVAVQQRLINDLLDVSRITTNKLELSMEVWDLRVSVQDSVEDQLASTPTRNILLDMQEVDAVLVLADRDRIGQVIANYLTNAVRYSKSDQPVTVGIAVRNQQAYVWVQDSGPGLSVQAQTQVWQRFYQEAGIAVQSGSGIGLGLGLYICQTIIARHDGHVGVESTLGQGATFWFTLPLA